MPRAAFFQFSNDTLGNLRRILGVEAANRALPGLQLAAELYAVSREHRTRLRNAREELSRTETLLRQVEKQITALSVDATYMLATTWDRDAVLSGEPLVRGREEVAKVAAQCHRAVRLIRIARRNTPHPPARLLAYGVAGALVHADQHLSKSRDGLFAKVLTEVWSAVEHAGGPEDVFPHIRPAADYARRQSPSAAPRKGRPRSQK